VLQLLVLHTYVAAAWYQPAATYMYNTGSCKTVWMLLIMSENVARNMYSSQGIINFPTELHLVGHFRLLFVSSVYQGKVWSLT